MTCVLARAVRVGIRKYVSSRLIVEFLMRQLWSDFGEGFFTAAFFALSPDAVPECLGSRCVEAFNKLTGHT